MKEIRIITTVQLTDIVRFEDSPELYNDIINSMNEVRENIIEEVRRQNLLADDVNVKVQFFVNDSGDVAADMLSDTSKTRDKCRNCRHRNFCGDHIVVKGLCASSGFENYMADDAD